MADPNSPDGPNGIYVLPFADTGHVRTVFRDVAYADRARALAQAFAAAPGLSGLDDVLARLVPAHAART